MKFLFDLGGVFFDWDPRYFYKNIFNDSKELDFFLSKVCNDEWNSKQDAGRLIKDAEKILITKYPKYEKHIRMYYNNHKKMIKSTFQNSISILTKLKNIGCKCYVLSNWSSETFDDVYKEYTFLKIFDGILISGHEKLIKPNPVIFQRAIKKFKLMPKKTLFIDDKLENINSAKKLGFITLHLIEPKKIYTEIEKYFV